MKVAVVGAIHELQLQSLINKLGDEYEVKCLDVKDREKLKENLKEVVVIILTGLRINSDTYDIFDAATKLKLIQIPWVGVDGTDFEYLKKRGIILCNSRWNTEITAEFTVSLMMTCAKKIVPSHLSLSRGSWEARGWASVRIKNSNVLILGHGTIPKEIIRLLSPYNVNVTAVRRSVTKSEKEKGEKEKNEKEVKEITWDGYEEAAGKSDFIICVLPLTPETKEILDEKKFAAMKKGAVFINVGRGDVVKEEALFNALKSGHLGSAGIDVWYTYNYAVHHDQNTSSPGHFPFHELSNIVMSPHRACNSTDALSAPNYWDTPLHNITSLHSHNNIINRDNTSLLRDVINVDVGY